ncbi:MAG: hypothetical protein HZC02_05245 [Candidatus Levybacteria bacterium]|nr:hypothetical protein [Candidatus Levybacteria bacterium]
MERLSTLSHVIKKEAAARVAGSVLSLSGGYSDMASDIASPAPIIRLEQDGGLQRYQQEFANIYEIRRDFDSALNIDTSYRLLSWDAVKSRNRFEQCRDKREQYGWLKNEYKDIASTLRERYNCLESPMDFFLGEDGNLYNSEFPAEPILTIIERGVLYQEAQGSQEIERERSELIGISKVQEYFADKATEIGSTMLLFSPPGTVTGSPYVKKFVDKYVLSEDPVTGKRIVTGKRYSTIMSYQEYQDAVLSLDPVYFDDEEGTIDAILLRKPIKLEGFENHERLLEQILSFDPDALTGYEFAIVDMICEPIKPLLIDAIVNWNPKTIAHIFNTLLHIGDEANALVRQGDVEGIKAMLVWSRSLDQEKAEKEVGRRGNLPIEVLAVGCGDSGGFFDNSVGQFGIAPENDPNLCRCQGAKPHFHCGGSIEQAVKDEDGNVIYDETGKEKIEEITCQFKVIVGHGVKKCPECGRGAVCA